jgi:type II secretory pathway pseudopilin PulG
MKREKGYIIIEAIAGLVILSVAASMVSSLLISSAVKLREFDRAVTARIIAANKLAAVKHLIRSGMAAAEKEQLAADSPMAERLRDFEGWAKVEDFREGLKQVEVVINWKERGGTRSIRLRSLVAEP